MNLQTGPGGFSSLEFLAQFAEAPRDPARDRPGGQIESFADDAVALVAREEAVEDLAAVRRERLQPLVDVQCLVEALDLAVDLVGERLLGRLLARAGAEPVDASVSRQLGEPGSDRGVVAQRVEPLERAGEDVLKDVLGVVLRQPESAHGDRVHVAREAFDELVPRLLLSRPAALDELRVSEFDGHRGTAIQADSRRKGRNRRLRPSRGRGKGVHGNGEEHHDESEKAVASPPRDRSFTRCIRRAGRGQAHTCRRRLVASRCSSRQFRGLTTGRLGSQSDSRSCSRAPSPAPQCGRTTARTGSRSRTAPHAATSSNSERLLGRGRDARTRHARARPGTRARDRLHPPAENRRTLGSRGQRSGGGLFGARFRWSLGAFGLARVEPFLEEDAQLLAGREHVLVARPARGQLHDPNVVVPVAVTASVGSCFIERRQRRATAQEAHDWGIS